MGGKASKGTKLERGGSMRKSQVKKAVQETKEQWEKVGDELWALPDENESREVYSSLKERIIVLKGKLDELADEVKKKDPALFESYVDRYSVYMTILEKKTKLPAAAMVEDVKVEEQSNTGSLRRKSKKNRTKQREKRVTKEEKNMNEIDRIRHEMMPMRDEILVFKGEKGDRLYHYLEESFLRFIGKLDGIETFDFPQLKHEKKSAVAYAKESLEVLEQVVERRGSDALRFKELKAKLEGTLSMHPGARSTIGMVKLKDYTEEVDAGTQSVESLDEYVTSSEMSCSSEEFEDQPVQPQPVKLKVTSI